MDSASSLGGDGVDSPYAPRRFHRNSFSRYGAFELFPVEGLPQNKGLFQLRQFLAHFSSFACCGSGAKGAGLASPERRSERRDKPRSHLQLSRSVLELSSASAPLGVLM